MNAKLYWRREPLEKGSKGLFQSVCNRDYRLLGRCGNGTVDCLASIVPTERLGDTFYRVKVSVGFGIPIRNVKLAGLWLPEMLPILQDRVKAFVTENWKPT